MGTSAPKQLIDLAGKPIIEYALAAFSGAPEIDDVLVVMAPGFLSTAEDIVRRGGYHKVSRVIEGGPARSDSTYRALLAIEDTARPNPKVLLHDAARPLVDHRIIRDCVAALERYDAVGTAIPSSDTILVVKDDLMTEIPDRGWLRRMQTPQGFRLSTIRKAYDLAMADPDFAATDDCGVVLRYLPDVAIRVVPGSERNIKLTHPADVSIAQCLLEMG